MTKRLAHHQASLWQDDDEGGDDNVISEMQVLVQRAQGGDREVFGAIYEQLAPKIYRFVYPRVSGDREVAEDLTAGVFLKLIEHLHRYQDRGLPFTTWVYRLAHNLVIDYFRAQPKGRCHSIDDYDHLAEPGAEDEIATALTRKELTWAFAMLTAEQRAVITFRFLQSLSIAETATRIGKSEDAIKKLQARGLLALRRILIGAGTTRGDLAA